MSYVYLYLVHSAFPSPAVFRLVLSKFLTVHITGQFRLLIIVARCWMETPCTVLNIWKMFLFGVPSKRCCQVCFIKQGAQGSTITTFNPLANQRYVLHIQGFSFSVCKEVVGTTQIFTKGLPAMLERTGRLVCLPRCTKEYHLFTAGLAWHTIGIYCSGISAFLEPPPHQKTSNHPIISR